MTIMRNLVRWMPSLSRLWNDRLNLIEERNRLTSQRSAGPRNFLFPNGVFEGTSTAPYMAYSFPIASDFYHPRFSEFLRRYNGHPFQMHRKLWEYAFIEHRLEEAGVLSAGKRGLGFGVGQELLPALFAKQGCTILATDAPAELIGKTWVGSNEFAPSAHDLNHIGVMEKEEFLANVSYETCDMNSIGSHLRGFDFCWSACCLEHLGSLQKGLDFIMNSLATLKPGGMACHTTELNLSSNAETVEEGGTVLYRRRDLEAFARSVAEAGHEIEPIVITPMATPIDHYVDVPPYSHDPHLKLLLGDYVSTSVGIVVRKMR